MNSDEFNFDSPDESESRKDPSNSIRRWLTSSPNRFSTLSTQTQISSSTQEVVYSMESFSTNVQLHMNTKKPISPSKVIHISPAKIMHIPLPQDSWDKIESITNSNDNHRNKENVDCMDIEALSADDIEYTSEKPHRSSRKKEVNKDEGHSNKPVEIKNVAIPFIQRSALAPQNLQVAINDNCATNTNSASTDTVDIAITVTMGRKITNIFIKQKEADVQVKTKTDREVQTSPGDLGVCNERREKNCNNTNCVEMNVNYNDTERPADNILIKNVRLNPSYDKSATTKKNTVSADFTTARSEITECIEKELSKIKDSEKTSDKRFSAETSNDIKTPTIIISEVEENQSRAELDCRNNIDIFGSGSIKDTNIHIPQEHSDMQISTTHNKSKNQKISGKRKRSDKDEPSISKKMYVTQEERLKDRVPDSEIIKNDKIPQQEEELLTPTTSNLTFSPSTFNDSINLNTFQEGQELNLTNQSLRKTVQDNYDGDKRVLEETPQNIASCSNVKRVGNLNKEENGINLSETSSISLKNETDKSVVNLSKTLINSEKIGGDDSIIDTISKKSVETPPTFKEFVDYIEYNTTSAPWKTLNSDNRQQLQLQSTHNDVLGDDPDKTLCTSSGVAKTTKKNESLRKAFEKGPTSMIKSPSTRRLDLKSNKKLCLAGSRLLRRDKAKIKYLCKERKWTYVERYTEDITHLVVRVNKEKKSQRSTKYMRALAASKWIVSIDWIKQCLIQKDLVDEEPFEALDSTGEPGPKRSRIAKKKLFEGIKFYCMPPFSVPDIDNVKSILKAAGGIVVESVIEVTVTPNTSAPALLLLEPGLALINNYKDVTMGSNIVLVDYNCVLDRLCSYRSNYDLQLLCPDSLLPSGMSLWL